MSPCSSARGRALKECDEEAILVGFPVLASDEATVLQLFQALRYRAGADQDKLQGRYGLTHDELKRGGGSAPRFDSVRAILCNHILATGALDNDELALDDKVRERRFHICNRWRLRSKRLRWRLMAILIFLGRGPIG